MIEEMLEQLGCDVAASVASVARAEQALRLTPFDVALLDVNLAGHTTFDLARDLAVRLVPFVFSTGYGTGGLPADLQDRPVLTKPFAQTDLQQALRDVLSAYNPGHASDCVVPLKGSLPNAGTRLL
jgi:CheY-like chemotaxis protein